MQDYASSLAAGLWEWLRTCPLLSGSAKIGVDYLADSINNYAIYAVPSTIRTTENVLGEVVPAAKQQQSFYFSSNESYGADTRQTMQNQALYDGIIAWIMEQNAKRILPKAAGVSVLSVMPSLTALIADAGANIARYQIQLQVTYWRD